MANKVDIGNMALGKLGQSVRIASLTEQSKHARVIAAEFDAVRDYVLQDAKFPFATTCEALALSEEVVRGWHYRYAYPADCLDARMVLDESVASQFNSAAPSYALVGDYLIPSGFAAFPGAGGFQIMYGDQETSIVTNIPNAYLLYTRRVDNLNRWPPMAIEALACRLGIVIAPAIAAEVGLRLGATLEQKYQIEKSRAVVSALNESGLDDEFVTPAMRART